MRALFDKLGSRSFLTAGVSSSAVAAALLCGSFAQEAFAQYLDTIPPNHPSIRYSQSKTSDPVSRLASQFASGQQRLPFRDDGLGYLPALLDAFGISVDSQALVFSKTSFQAAKISPRNPRAIYFNDEVAVGWVRGGDGIEIAALDPAQGMVFYTLDTRKVERPQLVRRQECLHCHQGTATLGVPGIFVGSVLPDAAGRPSRGAAIITDHSTPFADRWGGWYVNAAKGQQADRSNAVSIDPAEPWTLNTRGLQNRRDLVGLVDTTGYLAPVSDIVALMTFEHQTKVTNLMIRAGWVWRTSGRLEIDALADAMLFADEVQLREPLEGVSCFTTSFAARGPRATDGRSLRDFDLKTRLFRYPLSYMIYSAGFDGLPAPVRDKLYARLYQWLTRASDSRNPASGVETGKIIIAIVAATKPGVPGYWKTSE